MIRVLSLGAGVQSTTVLLMSLAGELPRLDAAVFADTREEPAAVYRHLWWLAARCADAGLPLYVVSDPRSSGLTQDLADVIEGRRRPGIAQPPVHVRGEAGRMQIRRQCTTHLKVTPIRRQVRALAGLTGRRSPSGPVVEQVIGISLDEAHRMRDTGEAWLVNAYPLVDRRMTRHDCPLRSNTDWRTLRDTDPAGWERAIAYDQLVRHAGPAFGGRGLTGEAFIHYSGQPLDHVDLSTPEARGQLSLFGNECQGMCGV